jgi:DNA-3-methyladenine glycosylase
LTLSIGNDTLFNGTLFIGNDGNGGGHKMRSGNGKRVEPEFFATPTLELAKQLLGMVLVHETEDGTTAGRIVDVEAYCGPEDKGAHSYGGRRTPRTEVMFGPPGYAYIYFIYGMYYCFNVVSGPVGKPEAILVRALEPLEGVALMARRRNMPWITREIALSAAAKDKLTGGPGRLTQAMGITKHQYGWNLWDSPLRIEYGDGNVDHSMIQCGPRINIEYAGEAKDYPWRFWIPR